MVTMANTKPPVDSEETVRYVLEEGKKTGIHVLPAACVSVGMKGQELTDMDALKAAGAVGFTDDGIPLMDQKLVRQAMLKAKELDVPLASMRRTRPSFQKTASMRVRLRRRWGSRALRPWQRMHWWPGTACWPSIQARL